MQRRGRQSVKLGPAKPLVSAHRGGHVVDGRRAAQRYRDAIARTSSEMITDEHAPKKGGE
jgi:hypothetical protein